MRDINANSLQKETNEVQIESTLEPRTRDLVMQKIQQRMQELTSQAEVYRLEVNVHNSTCRYLILLHEPMEITH